MNWMPRSKTGKMGKELVDSVCRGLRQEDLCRAVRN